MRALAEAGGKLVVVDFTAAWCGPCKAIAPEVDRLSIKYPHVVFLKVDVDKVQAVAQEARVSAMPTFHFLKNRVKVADIVGAQRDKLEPTIKQHETAADLGAGEGSGSATKTQTTVAGHVSSSLPPSSLLLLPPRPPFLWLQVREERECCSFFV